jgi:hypothetical protein
MADSERLANNNERTKSPDELQHIRQEQLNRIHEQHEKPVDNVEQSPEKTRELVDDAREKAKDKEQLAKPERKAKNLERRRDGIAPKAERAASYKHTMKQVQSELPPVNRAFSKFIHNKTVERVSDTVGSTVARPNAILAGSFMAFVFTLTIFLVARYYGYPLSGTETIAAFALGWMAGLLFDYLRLEFTGGRKS